MHERMRAWQRVTRVFVRARVDVSLSIDRSIDGRRDVAIFRRDDVGETTTTTTPTNHASSSSSSSDHEDVSKTTTARLDRSVDARTRVETEMARAMDRCAMTEASRAYARAKSGKHARDVVDGVVDACASARRESAKTTTDGGGRRARTRGDR